MCTKCKVETCSNTKLVLLYDDDDTAPTLLNIEVNDEDEKASQP